MNLRLLIAWSIRFACGYHIAISTRRRLHALNTRASDPDESPVSLPSGGIRTASWARGLGLEPGYGGYWPGDPDAMKYKVTIRSPSQKELCSYLVPEDRYIYFYLEEQGVDLPIVNKSRMCSQGCCTICTGKVLEGKYEMDSPLGLLKDMRKQGYVLTCTSKSSTWHMIDRVPLIVADLHILVTPCNCLALFHSRLCILILNLLTHTMIAAIAYPRSDMVIELQDEDEMYVKQWSEGFEGGGVQWGGFLPDDD